MNSKLILAVLLSLTSSIPARAEDTNTTFEVGMLEEEANHQLGAAIQNYRDSLAYLITNRQMLATAVQKFTARGEYLAQWGSKGTAPGLFDYPQGVASDRNGHIYVADTHNHRNQKLTEDGEFILQWGKLGSKPGQFDAPYSIAIEPGGNPPCASTMCFTIVRPMPMPCVSRFSSEPRR